MRPLWIRILLGAAAIFVVGIIAVTQTRKGIASVRQAIEAEWSGGLGDLSSQLGELRLEGTHLGTIRRVQLRPDARQPMVVTVAADRSAADRLSRCHAVASTGSELFDKETLVCRPADELEGFARYGTVMLADSSLELPLYGPADAVAEFQAKRNREPKSVDIVSDGADGALVTVRDPAGKEIRIRADSGGASIDVRDQRGRAVFQLQADSLGLRLHTDEER